MVAADKVPPQIHRAIPDYVFAAISLTIPQPEISSLSQPTARDMRISLENSSPQSQRLYDLTATHLVQSLTQDPYPHVLLLTSNATATTPLTVMGAYFPSTLSYAEGEKRKLKPSTPHLLFQLQPQFRLYRWNGPQIPLADIIKTEDDAPLSGAITASEEPSSKATKRYRIGDPERKAAGLCIDPETKSATLTSSTTDTDIGDVVGYKPVCINNTNSGIKLDSNWKVAVKIDHFEILRVKGGIDTNVAFERANTLVRYAPQHATEERIKREELSKRIQGFGSTSY